jgi:hypothetical protein
MTFDSYNLSWSALRGDYDNNSKPARQIAECKQPRCPHKGCFYYNNIMRGCGDHCPALVVQMQLERKLVAVRELIENLRDDYSKQTLLRNQQMDMGDVLATLDSED